MITILHGGVGLGTPKVITTPYKLSLKHAIHGYWISHKLRMLPNFKSLKVRHLWFVRLLSQTNNKGKISNWSKMISRKYKKNMWMVLAPNLRVTLRHLENGCCFAAKYFKGWRYLQQTISKRIRAKLTKETCIIQHQG